VIKQLAKESLIKWYMIRMHEMKDRTMSQIEYRSNCAFCDHAERQGKDSNSPHWVCCYCILPEDVCDIIKYCEDNYDSSIMIECLEDLAKDGMLNDKLAKKLKRLLK